MKEPPNVSKELIDYLKETFPDKFPQHAKSWEDVVEARGRLDVVRHLESLRAAASRNVRTNVR